jgi:hypothetical protein
MFCFAGESEVASDSPWRRYSVFGRKDYWEHVDLNASTGLLRGRQYGIYMWGNCY